MTKQDVHVGQPTPASIVHISSTEYASLLANADFLAALYQTGVEEWEHYGKAQEAYGNSTNWRALSTTIDLGEEDELSTRYD